MRRIAQWSLVLAGLVVAAGLAVRSERGASGANSAPPATTPEVTLRTIHMLETREGSKLWELWADRAEVHEREGFAVLAREQRPVEVALYSSQGRLTCTANRATVDLKTKDVRLEGSVVARSDQGTELRTEELRWLAASRRIQTDRPVTLTRGGLLTRGRGLEAETDLEQVRIFQNITSQLPAPEPAPVRGTPNSFGGAGAAPGPR